MCKESKTFVRVALFQGQALTQQGQKDQTS